MIYPGFSLNTILWCSGIGAGMMIVCALVGIYYNMIIAWAIFYLFASFTSDLPWQHCDNDYNTLCEYTQCNLHTKSCILYTYSYKCLQCSNFKRFYSERGKGIFLYIFVCFHPVCSKLLNTSITNKTTCDENGFYVNTLDGVCYTNDSLLTPKGFWDEKLASREGKKSVLPSDDYLK